MRKLLTAAALGVAALTLAACGSSTPSAPAVPAAEQQAITAMAGHCSQNPVQLAAMIGEAHALEVKAGITDEDTAQLSQHLATVVASYKNPVDCSQPFGAYVTMREGGSS